MSIILEHPNGKVEITELGSGRRRISVQIFDATQFVPYDSAETSYSVELIQSILAWRGPSRLCYSILRDESGAHLKDPLRYQILSYVDDSFFAGRRVLDFGCGSGASIVALAQMFPEATVVAVDLEPKNLEVAAMRVAHHGISGVEFLLSPGGDQLPDGLGTVGAICLSAVYEHLLPGERPTLLRKLWAVLDRGGILFVNQLPHRWYPLEFHTTGLPLLNYLPDRPAFAAARRWSARVKPTDTWEALLRGGIRGGTEGEILRTLRGTTDGEPELLSPTRLGVCDGADLWYACSMDRRPLRVKGVFKVGFKAVSKLTGSTFTPSLNLAIRKR